MSTTKKMKRCCGTSVGVIIQNPAGDLLMVTRGWWPKGTAPVAGHVKDAHTDVASALAEQAYTTPPGEYWLGGRP